MKKITLLAPLLGLIVSLVFASCATYQKKTAQKENVIVKPKLLFLTYSIFKTSEGNIQAKLIDKIIVEGKMKESIVGNKMFEPGDIQCIQVNKNSMEINTINMSNPLVKTVEYSDETGRLFKKQIELDSTQLSIRMQLHSQSKFVVLKRHNTVGNSPITLTKNEL